MVIHLSLSLSVKGVPQVDGVGVVPLEGIDCLYFLLYGGYLCIH